jgi:hypothetical protein
MTATILRMAGVYDDLCHSPARAHRIQRIYKGQLAGHLYSGEVSHGQAYVHLDDVVDAIERAADRRAQLPPETPILIGEPETLSYDELQHTFTRLSFDSSGAMADSDHLIGALVMTFSIMAFAEVGRAIRFLNIPFGAWLIAAPWLLDGIASPLAVLNGVISGVVLIALAVPRGKSQGSVCGMGPVHRLAGTALWPPIPQIMKLIVPGYPRKTS